MAVNIKVEFHVCSLLKSEVNNEEFEMNLNSSVLNSDTLRRVWSCLKKVGSSINFIFDGVYYTTHQQPYIG